MSSLDSFGGRAASAGLAGVALAPLMYFWVVSMRGAISKATWSQPVPLSHLFLRTAMPVAALGVSLASASYAILAAIRAGRIQVEVSKMAGVYLGLSASFFVLAAAILSTVTIYLTTLAVLYAAWRQLRWWSLLRLDAFAGGAILLILAVVYWAKSMIGADTLGPAALLPTRTSLAWLLIIVDIVLVLLAAGVVGAASYAMPKVKGRVDIVVGHTPTLLVTASLLWLLRCTFVLTVDIKSSLALEWSYDEVQVQSILRPILDLWIMVAVLALLTSVIRHPVWSDPTALPANDPPQQQPIQMQPQPPWPQELHGQQQYMQYQQYPQWPTGPQQQQAGWTGPAPNAAAYATVYYEADGTRGQAPAVELQASHEDKKHGPAEGRKAE